MRIDNYYIESIYKYFNVNEEDIKGKRQARKYTTARLHLIGAYKTKYKIHVAKIAILINRDVENIKYHLRNYKKYTDIKDPSFMIELKGINAIYQKTKPEEREPIKFDNLTGSEIELTLLSEAMARKSKNNTYLSGNKIYNVSLLVDICSDIFSIPSSLILSNSRKTEAVWSRYFIYKHLKAGTTLSLSNIGMQVGMKDHSSVLHGLKTHDVLLETDKVFQEMAHEFNIQVN